MLGFAGGASKVAAVVNRSPTPLTPPQADDGLRWARFVTARPVAVLVVAVLGLAVAAIPATDLRLGLPDDGMGRPGQHPAQGRTTCSAAASGPGSTAR